MEIRRRFEELGVKDLASSLKLCPTASASATAREIRAEKRGKLDESDPEYLPGEGEGVQGADIEYSSLDEEEQQPLMIEVHLLSYLVPGKNIFW